MEVHGWLIVVPLIIWPEMKACLHPLIIMTILRKLSSMDNGQGDVIGLGKITI
jgi:hypothetical protein